MRYTKYVEAYTPEHVYIFTTIPCPTGMNGCGETEEIIVKAPDLFAYRQSGDMTDLNVSVDQRERFLSGFCSSCWDKIFKE